MATDQEIRDAGLKYVPKQKYLQNPYELPVEETTPDNGITNTNAFADSQRNDFSVYNPDPNTISNQNYRPNYEYRRFSEPDQSMIEMGRNQDYFYKPPVNSKMQGLMGMIPGAGVARFLANQIGPYIPPNRRAIMENELGGQGIMVNDIGQIVQGQGDYNTAANVMAGYNVSKMTADTFNDRIKSIENRDADQTDASRERIEAIKQARTDFLRTQEKADKIFDFEEEEKKKRKKDTVVGRYLTKKKATKDDKIAAAADETSAQNYPTGGSYNAPGDDNITDRRDSDFDGNVGLGSNANAVRAAMRDNDSDTGSAQSYNQNLARGGRAGYFFGGRVNYKIGGRVGFKNGGLASIL